MTQAGRASVFAPDMKESVIHVAGRDDSGVIAGDCVNMAGDFPAVKVIVQRVKPSFGVKCTRVIIREKSFCDDDDSFAYGE